MPKNKELLRELNQFEKQNIKELNNSGLEFCLVQPTKTGLGKYYFDAHARMRKFLVECKIHDYSLQGRGARENGQHFPAVLLKDDSFAEIEAHFYKPKAKSWKDGDPRVWFSSLNHHVNADDILAICFVNSQDLSNGYPLSNQIRVINITKTNLASLLASKKSGPIRDYFNSAKINSNVIANELLEKLREIASLGPLPSVMPGYADTAIGRTVEHALGIPMNSSRAPDYKGIELKSSRERKNKNRDGLFAKVPDWSISKMQSMEEILHAFGYMSMIKGDYRKRLNVTVKANKPNRQGLYFDVDHKNDLLSECSTNRKYGKFASWRLSHLYSQLLKKHNETFWISAKTSIDKNGNESFELMEVVHTRKPIASQLNLLLEQGDITMDHEMKLLDNGNAKERGPQFKMKKSVRNLLLSNPQKYTINAK